MERKIFSGVEIKDADKGIVEAVFSTLDVLDSDRDVTISGAFQDGAPVRISAYGHASWSGELPIGRGTIRAGEKDAVLEGQFFLKAAHARDTFEVVKEMGDLQEWSYGFDIIKQIDPGADDWKAEWTELGAQRVLAELYVFEVSPVLRGAGVDTRTLAVKGGAKGDSLAALLNRLIDDRVTDSRTRTDVIESLSAGSGDARGAGRITPSTVNQILRGEIICPPLARLQGFARVLSASADSLTAAGRRDGCDYDMESAAREEPPAIDSLGSELLRFQHGRFLRLT